MVESDELRVINACRERYGFEECVNDLSWAEKANLYGYGLGVLTTIERGVSLVRKYQFDPHEFPYEMAGEPLFRLGQAFTTVAKAILLGPGSTVRVTRFLASEYMQTAQRAAESAVLFLDMSAMLDKDRHTLDECPKAWTALSMLHGLLGDEAAHDHLLTAIDPVLAVMQEKGWSTEQVKRTLQDTFQRFRKRRDQVEE